MNTILLFVITLAVSTALLITWKALDGHADPHLLSLRHRAERVFSYEKNGGKLSFNQLAALSVALEFRDYQGAEILVSSLEHQIQGR